MMQPHETIALAFAQHLIVGEFALAHALLSPTLAAQLDMAALQSTYQSMVSYFATTANHVEVIEALSDWPGKLPSDVAWVYVAIDNGKDSEAVSVTLESVQSNAENVVQIRLIEWGRP
jgi:hypothetical protein